jgi:hypothetical protein
MKKYIITPAIALAALLFGTGTATADPSSYIDYLQKDTYLVSKYSSQQLLAEGNKVCDAVSRGAKDLDAVDMVKRDLSVSDGAAIDVYSAATNLLGC